MKLHYLRIENFMSFKGYSELRFGTKKSPILIVGENQDEFDSNGSGKSTIFEAIYWVLYGRTIRGYTGDEVTHNGSGFCGVCVDFRDESGQPLCVTRSRGPNKLELMYMGKTFDAPTLNAMQDIINSILGPPEVFLNSYMFGKDEGSKSFASKGDADQKDIFESILRLAVIDDAREEAKERKATSIAQSYVTEGHLNGRVNSFNTLSDRANTLRKYHKDWKDEKYLQIKGLKQELFAVSKSTVSYDQVDDALVYAYELATFETTLVKMRDRVLQQEHRILTLSARTDMLGKQFRDVAWAYEELIKSPGVCTLCNQKIPVVHADPKKVMAFQDEMDDLKIRIVASNDILSKAEGGLKTLSSLVRGPRNLALDLSGIRALGNRLVLYRNTKQAKLESIRSQIDFLGNLKSPHVQEYQRCLSDRLLISGTIKEHKKSLKILAKLQEDLDFWIEGFGNKGVRSLMVNKYLPYLNDRIAYYASKLCPNMLPSISAVTVNKSGQFRDRIAITIKSGSTVKKYKGLSGGERGRTDVCVLLAMKDLTKTIGSRRVLEFSMFDEVFDALDKTGVDAVCSLLEEQGQDEQIFIITHSEDLKSRFSNRLLVTKKDGASGVERI